MGRTFVVKGDTRISCRALRIGYARLQLAGITNGEVGARIRRRVADVTTTIGILRLRCTFTTCPRHALPKVGKVAAISISATGRALV
jgi:hypothetical protein